jgi:hypothetical protein
MLKPRPKLDYKSQLLDSLKAIRGVNKTDVQVMIENFGVSKDLPSQINNPL